MLSIIFAIVARLAIIVGISFIFSRTLPMMPNKVWSFVFLFALFVPFILVINGVYVRLLGRHNMSWIEISIGALLFAILGTFCAPQLYDSSWP
jgi:hypothetical protein